MWTRLSSVTIHGIVCIHSVKLFVTLHHMHVLQRPALLNFVYEGNLELLFLVLLRDFFILGRRAVGHGCSVNFYYWVAKSIKPFWGIRSVFVLFCSVLAYVCRWLHARVQRLYFTVIIVTVYSSTTTLGWEFSVWSAPFPFVWLSWWYLLNLYTHYVKIYYNSII